MECFYIRLQNIYVSSLFQFCGATKRSLDSRVIGSLLIKNLKYFEIKAVETNIPFFSLNFKKLKKLWNGGRIE